MIAPAFYVSLVPAAERSAHLAVGACAIQMAQICAGQMAQISERPVYRGLLRASAGSFGSRKAEALSASDTRS